MKKSLYALSIVTTLVAVDELVSYAARFGYQEGMKNGHKDGHECMLNAMKKSPTFREAAESMPQPMHTEN